MTMMQPAGRFIHNSQRQSIRHFTTPIQFPKCKLWYEFSTTERRSPRQTKPIFSRLSIQSLSLPPSLTPLLSKNKIEIDTSVSSPRYSKDHNLRRAFATTSNGNGEDAITADDDDRSPRPNRVWRPTDTNSSSIEGGIDGPLPSSDNLWKRVVDEYDLSSMRDALDRVSVQERQGGRMRTRRLGVVREDPKEDMRILVENYTAPALASALRDREDVLQTCATLLASNRIDELSKILRPFEKQFVNIRRQKELRLDLTGGYDTLNLEMLRKGLNRMPRRVSQAHQRRAGVVIPLCNVDSVPCILFEKRSQDMRAHPDEVCLPGGMVSSSNDQSIVATCLREMEEEIEGVDVDTTKVLGVLRCNWGEVHHLVGVAVTPVVCFLGEIGDTVLRPNPDEVAEVFTVPLSLFLDHDKWVHRQDFAPIFTGGPHIIWGLTGYIIDRFVKDVLARYRIQVPSHRY